MKKKFLKSKNKILALFLSYFLNVNCAQERVQLPYVVLRDPGTNNYMQDRSCAHIEYDHAFFGIFDGHGTPENGHMISDFLSKHFYKIVMCSYDLPDAFKAIDAQLSRELNMAIIGREGSTASVVFIRDKKVHIGHVGDTKIVLIKNGQAIALTEDHKVKGKDWQRIIELIKQSSNAVKFYKNRQNAVYLHFLQLNLMFNMTRSFGDRNLYPYVISNPDFKYMEFTDEDEFLILGTDGLWDTISSISPDLSAVIKIFNKHENWVNKAQALFDFAKERWATSKSGSDNMEFIVVNLEELRKFHKKREEEEKELLIKTFNLSL